MMLTRFMLAATATATAIASPAFAQFNPAGPAGPAGPGDFLAGFSHPLVGLDHILAMIAVGLWAAMLGGRALLAVPAAFVGTMIAGFALATTGVALPLVEPMVAASVVVLGLVVAMAVRLPATAGALLVGAFALFHGHAHGVELGAAAVLPYLAGFAVATALLHGAGIGSGYLFGAGGKGGIVARIAGGLTAALGVGLAVGAI